MLIFLMESSCRLYCPTEIVSIGTATFNQFARLKHLIDNIRRGVNVTFRTIVVLGESK